MPSTWPGWIMFWFFAIGALGGWLRVLDFIEELIAARHRTGRAGGGNE